MSSNTNRMILLIHLDLIYCKAHYIQILWLFWGEEQNIKICQIHTVHEVSNTAILCQRRFKKICALSSLSLSGLYVIFVHNINCCKL